MPCTESHKARRAMLCAHRVLLRATSFEIAVTMTGKLSPGRRDRNFAICLSLTVFRETFPTRQSPKGMPGENFLPTVFAQNEIYFFFALAGPTRTVHHRGNYL